MRPFLVQQQLGLVSDLKTRANGQEAFCPENLSFREICT
jgi:hypothetical protein